MCKPHKEIARDIAKTGSLDEPDYNLPRSSQEQTGNEAARYYVAMLAMAMFRTEQVIPSLFENACYDPATLVGKDVESAFADANLAVNKSCIHSTFRGIKAYRDTHIETLRSAMDDTALYLKGSGSDLTLEALRLPALPDKQSDHGEFLDNADTPFFTGYDNRADRKSMSYASKPLKLVESIDGNTRERLQSITPGADINKLHEGVAYFLAQPDVVTVMKQMFDNKLVHIIRSAPADLKAGRGEIVACSMCAPPAVAQPSVS